MPKPKTSQKRYEWYQEPKWALIIGVLALAAAYSIGSRSLDTGSWQQYFMTLGLLILGINRLAHTTKHAVHRWGEGKGLRKA